MKIYNKLVRDNIPEIIENANKKYDIHYANKEEVMTLLETKLKEETSEFLQEKNIEELADILEVIFALNSSLGYSKKDLLNKREEKRKARGGFEKGIVLEKVYE